MHKHMSISMAAVVALAVLCVLGPANDRSALADEEREAKFELKLEGETPMESFLKAVSQTIDTPIVWDPGDKQIRGKNIQSTLHIAGTRDEIFDRVRSLLTFYELVMIPVGATENQIYLVMDARRTTSILKLKAEYIVLNEGNLSSFETKDGLYVTTTIRVQNMTDLRNARNALTRIVTGQNIGNVTEVPDAKAFVVTDFAPNVVAIYRLLKEMDARAEVDTNQVLETVKLQHGRAEDVANGLMRLFPPSSATGAQRGTAPAVRAPVGVRFFADPRTNQIVVAGAPEEVQRVLAAIATLDIEVAGAAQVPQPKPVAQSTHMVRLSHLEAGRTASVLSQLTSRSVEWLQMNGGRGYPVIVADPQIEALIISGSEEAITKLQRLIREMDEAAGQDAAAAREGDK